MNGRSNKTDQLIQEWGLPGLIILIFAVILALIAVILGSILYEQLGLIKDKHGLTFVVFTVIGAVMLYMISAACMTRVYGVNRLAQAAVDLSSDIKQSIVQLTHFSEFTVSEIDGVFDKALAATESHTLIARPKRYGKLIHTVAQIPDAPDTVNLIGTMAGFCFTVAHPMADYMTQRQDTFDKLNIYATDIKLVGGGQTDHTSIFALYFVGKLFKKYFENLEKKTNLTVCAPEVTVYYMDMDVFSAAIHFPSKECIVLQAMSVDSLKKMMEEKGPLLGLRYEKNNERFAEIFHHYSRAIDGYQVKLASKEDYREKWKVELKKNQAVTLTITNPRWGYTQDTNSKIDAVQLIPDREEYFKHTQKNHVLDFQSPSDVKVFFDTFLKSVAQEGIGTKIAELESGWLNL